MPARQRQIEFFLRREKANSLPMLFNSVTAG
jgi:hypothetical protein